MLFPDVHKQLAERYQADPFAGWLPARIKNLIRLGCVEGVSSGRGRPMTFTEAQFRRIRYAMDLTNLGVHPERAIELVEANIDKLESSRGVVSISISPVFGSRAFGAIEIPARN